MGEIFGEHFNFEDENEGFRGAYYFPQNVVHADFEYVPPDESDRVLDEFGVERSVPLHTKVARITRVDHLSNRGWLGRRYWNFAVLLTCPLDPDSAVGNYGRRVTLSGGFRVKSRFGSIGKSTGLDIDLTSQKAPVYGIENGRFFKAPNCCTEYAIPLHSIGIPNHFFGISTGYSVSLNADQMVYCGGGAGCADLK